MLFSDEESMITIPNNCHDRFYPILGGRENDTSSSETDRIDDIAVGLFRAIMLNPSLRGSQ